MSSQPMVRARGPQSTLATMQRLYPEAYRVVLERAPVDALELIRRSLPTTWIPMEHDMRIFVPAWTQWLGDDLSRQICKSAVDETVLSPALRPLVEFALRAMGSTPGGVLKVLPRGWDQVYRNCAKVSVERVDETSARVYFRELAPLVAGSFHAFHYPIRAILEVLCSLTDHEGEVVFDDELRLSRSTAHLTWSKL